MAGRADQHAERPRPRRWALPQGPAEVRPRGRRDHARQARPVSPTSRPRPGPTASATAPASIGCSTSTRRRRRRTPPSARGSTPTASPSTRSASPICSPASPASRSRRWRSPQRCAPPRAERKTQSPRIIEKQWLTRCPRADTGVNATRRPCPDACRAAGAPPASAMASVTRPTNTGARNSMTFRPTSRQIRPRTGPAAERDRLRAGGDDECG